MFTEVELMDAINELNNGKSSIQNCEKLASIFTVLDHMYPNKPMEGYSMASPPVIGLYGKSDFLKTISDKSLAEVLPLFDELVEAIYVLNPKLYRRFMERLQSKRDGE